ncbi:MAG: polyphenol oxidase family protein [Candidatus Dormibacteraceae bacterium]
MAPPPGVITIPGLAPPELIHGFSTREQGSMSGARAQANFAALMGLSEGRVASAVAVHGADVAVVTEPGSIPHVDALVTVTPGLGLMILIADCYAVVLLDPVRSALGLVHSGWRGAAQRVVEATLGVMGREFGTLASDVVAGIGPGICGACYEVGPEVARQFDHAFVRPSEGGRWLLDLRACITAQLLGSGVISPHIHAHHSCTKESVELPSHRRDGNGERFACLAAMR